ncbi:unnamed protein product [Calicophoron daubneyi]
MSQSTNIPDNVVENSVGSSASNADTGFDSSKKAPSDFLTAGTAVSAKYRGAFCEATVDRVELKFRLRVQLNDSKTVVSVDQNGLVSGKPVPGSEVMVRIPTPDYRSSATPQWIERAGHVLRVVDTSVYTVVFDDGDKRILRRTQLVIKGERHFKESESLDCLPLTNPEQFRQPVIDRRRRTPEDVDDNEDFDFADEEIGGNEVEPTQFDSKQPREEGNLSDISEDKHSNNCSALETARHGSGGTDNMSSSEPLCEMTKPSDVHGGDEDTEQLPIDELQKLSPLYHRFLGRLVLVDMPLTGKDRLDSPPQVSNQTGMNTSTNSSTGASDTGRRRFVPGLVVLPSAMPSIDIKSSAGFGKSSRNPVLLVRSFKDNRFMGVPVCYVKRIKRPLAVELAHTYPSLRTAFERALLWLDRYELPAAWGENAIKSLLGAKDWRTTKRLYRSLSADISKASDRASSKSVPTKKSHTGSLSSVSSDSASADEEACVVRSKRASKHCSPQTTSAKKFAAKKRAHPADTGVGCRMKSKKPRLKISSHRIKHADDSSNHSSQCSNLKPSVPKKASKVSKRSSRPRRRAPQAIENDSSDSESSANSSSSSKFGLASSLSSVLSSTSSSDSDSSSSSSSVDFEARDRWIAQLYSFMDEGGTPINKAPSLANKDLDLYRLYKLVRELGGFHRVTSQMKWGYIYSKLRLPHHFSAGPRSLQAAFKRYLYPLDDISRKLGIDLGELPLSRPRHQPSSTAHSAASSHTGVKSTSSGRGGGQPRQSATEMRPEKSVETKSSSNKMDTSTERSAESSPPVLSPPIHHQPSPTVDAEPLSPVMRTPRKQSTASSPDAVYKGRTPKRSYSQASRTSRVTKATTTPITKASSQKTKSLSDERKLEKLADENTTASELKGQRSVPTAASGFTPLDELSNIKVNSVIPVGSRIRVRCGDHVAYEAKVLKHIRPQSALCSRPLERASSSAPWPAVGGIQYRVHYMGWNTRHDEVVSRSRIISVIEWARTSDSERPPSCSSFNLIVQEPHRPHYTKETCSSSMRRLKTPVSTEKSTRDIWPKNRKRTIGKDEVDDEDSVGGDAIIDDEYSDHSQTTETASDIVTTTAPMVRRRRLMFRRNTPLKERRGARINRIRPAISGQIVSEVCESQGDEFVHSKNEPSLKKDGEEMPHVEVEVATPPSSSCDTKLTFPRTHPTLPVVVGSGLPSGKRPRLGSSVCGTVSVGLKESRARERVISVERKKDQTSVGKKQNNQETELSQVQAKVENLDHPLSSSSTTPGNGRDETIAKSFTKAKTTKLTLKVDSGQKSSSKLTLNRHQKKLAGQSLSVKRLTDKARKMSIFKDGGVRLAKSHPKRSLQPQAVQLEEEPNTGSVERPHISYASGKEDNRNKTGKKMCEKPKVRAMKQPETSVDLKSDSIQRNEKAPEPIEKTDLEQTKIALVRGEKKLSVDHTTTKTASLKPKVSPPAGKQGISKKSRSAEDENAQLADGKDSVAAGKRVVKDDMRRKAIQRTRDQQTVRQKPHPGNSGSLISRNKLKPAGGLGEVKRKIQPGGLHKRPKGDLKSSNADSIHQDKITLNVPSTSAVSGDKSRPSSKVLNSCVDDSDSEHHIRHPHSTHLHSRDCLRPVMVCSPKKAYSPGNQLNISKRAGVHSSLRELAHGNRKQNRSSEESSTDSESESSVSDFGAMDALPRLTRSQHRQLLGDTPPGAVLQTASPIGLVVSVQAAPKDEIKSTAVKTPEVTDTSDEGHIAPNAVQLESINTESTEDSLLKPISVKIEDEISPDLLPDVASDIESHSTEVKVEVKKESFENAKNEYPGITGTQFTTPPERTIKMDADASTVDTPKSNEELDKQSKSCVQSDDENDDQSSVRTMSTDPMKGVAFDLTMSPGGRTSGSSSSSNSDLESLTDVAGTEHTHCDVEDIQADAKSCFKEISTHSEYGKDEIMEDSSCQGVESVTLSPLTYDEVINFKDSGQLLSKARLSHDRSRYVSTSSGAESSGRRHTKKLGSTPNRAHTSERSPSPASYSQHSTRSPHSSGNLSSPTSNSEATKQPVSSSYCGHIGPTHRRFGGPFFPISGYDELSSESKCQLLQERMHRILEAWRQAKQYLKDLDQRSSRTRRLRARQCLEAQITLGNAVNKQTPEDETQSSQETDFSGHLDPKPVPVEQPMAT